MDMASAPIEFLEVLQTREANCFEVAFTDTGVVPKQAAELAERKVVHCYMLARIICDLHGQHSLLQLYIQPVRPMVVPHWCKCIIFQKVGDRDRSLVTDR